MNLCGSSAEYTSPGVTRVNLLWSLDLLPLKVTLLVGAFTHVLALSEPSLPGHPAVPSPARHPPVKAVRAHPLVHRKGCAVITSRSRAKVCVPMLKVCRSLLLQQQKITPSLEFVKLQLPTPTPQRFIVEVRGRQSKPGWEQVKKANGFPLYLAPHCLSVCSALSNATSCSHSWSPKTPAGISITQILKEKKNDRKASYQPTKPLVLYLHQRKRDIMSNSYLEDRKTTKRKLNNHTQARHFGILPFFYVLCRFKQNIILPKLCTVL